MKRLRHILRRTSRRCIADWRHTGHRLGIPVAPRIVRHHKLVDQRNWRFLGTGRRIDHRHSVCLRGNPLHRNTLRIQSKCLLPHRSDYLGRGCHRSRLVRGIEMVMPRDMTHPLDSIESMQRNGGFPGRTPDSHRPLQSIRQARGDTPQCNCRHLHNRCRRDTVHRRYRVASHTHVHRCRLVLIHIQCRWPGSPLYILRPPQPWLQSNTDPPHSPYRWHIQSRLFLRPYLVDHRVLACLPVHPSQRPRDRLYRRHLTGFHPSSFHRTRQKGQRRLS